MTDADASLTFIGNATALLRLGPFTLLTDPDFLHAGQRAYLGNGLWSKRLPGADLVGLLQPSRVVPVDVDDYTVFTSPLADFVSALGDDRDRLVVVGRGETAPLSRGSAG